MARIASLATAVPNHRCAQSQTREAAARIFAGLGLSAKRLAVFENAAIETRHFCEPLAYYETDRPFGEKNGRFIGHALELGEKAIRLCLERGRRRPQEIDHILCITTTGLSTPSLEARLCSRLPFRPNVKRTPIFGAGCAGGAVGLSRAFDYLKAFPDQRVLLLCVELCSLTFQAADLNMKNLVASALFADGAACVLLEGDQAAGASGGPALLASESHLFPDSLDVMGWDFSEKGMHVVMSPRIPNLVASSFRSLAEAFLSRQGLSLGDVRHFLLHPGGAKVVEAYEQALGLDRRALSYLWDFLRKHGNLSSASVFFVLEDFLSQERPAPGDLGLIAALGPGFAAEMLLVQW